MKIGQKIIQLDSIDSTNNYVAKLLQNDQIDHGTVILAVEQFDGKGYRDSKWSVKPGENLTFSVFLDNVNMTVNQQFILTQIVSLSLVYVLKRLNIKSEIKWPNDIFVKGKKIAGVLIENQLKSTVIKTSIIGIGLNVNQIGFKDFIATSIKAETGEFKNIDDVLYLFIDLFNELWNKFSEDGNNLNINYHNSLHLRNITAEYEDSTGRFIGAIKGVKPSGRLLIEKEGVIKDYGLKEIKFIKKNVL